MPQSGSDFRSFVDEHMPNDCLSEIERFSSVVCAATQGTPVVFVSPEFEAHTGYTPSEIVGKSLSLLQGPGSEPSAVAEFRDLISHGREGTVRITNYRKDGQRFRHECELRPIRSPDGELTHFVAIQRPIVD